MKKISKNILILVILSITLITSIILNKTIINNILDYTKLFIQKVFPTSFIFITISNLMIEFNLIPILQKIFHFKSTYIYILILSLFSGFPSGAIYTKKLLENNIITTNDANKIIMFTHFPNPLFIINSVELVLNSNKLSIIILISIILSNIIIFLLKNNVKRKTSLTIQDNIDFSKSLVNNITNSFKIIINIYGISLFFYLISSIINLYIKNIYVYSFIYGIFDLTKGIYSTLLINNLNIKCIFIILFISFGSISIHFQTKSILSDTNIKYINYLKGRIIGTILSIIIFLFIIKLST